MTAVAGPHHNYGTLSRRGIAYRSRKLDLCGQVARKVVVYLLKKTTFLL
jgi:hypothetical protein